MARQFRSEDPTGDPVCRTVVREMLSWLRDIVRSDKRVCIVVLRYTGVFIPVVINQLISNPWLEVQFCGHTTDELSV